MLSSISAFSAAESRAVPPPPPPNSDEDQGETRGCGPRLGLFGRHRGGPFDAGALRLVVLGLIAESPRHGYEIIKALRTRFQGSYAPSPGAIYPMLHMLAGAGLVSSTSWGLKRRFAITDAGKAYLEEHRAELDALNAQLEEAAAPMEQSSIGEAIRELRAALFAKMRKGGLSPEQAEALRAALRRAREDIDRI
jgi:DNA-binding PadR family transcriptional regulator